MRHSTFKGLTECVGITVTLNIYYYYNYSMYECFKLTSSHDETDMQDSVAISHVVHFLGGVEEQWDVFGFYFYFSLYFLLDQSRGTHYTDLWPLLRPRLVGWH